MAKTTHYIFLEDYKALPPLEVIKKWAGANEVYLLGAGEESEAHHSYSEAADSIRCFMDEFYKVVSGTQAYALVICADKLSDFVTVGLSGLLSEVVVDANDETLKLCHLSDYSKSLYECIDNLIGMNEEIESVVMLACDEQLCDDLVDLNETSVRIQNDIRYLYDSLMTGVLHKFESISKYKGKHAISK